MAVAAGQEGEAMKLNRLDTMARFEEPSDPKVVFICPECKYEFYEGDPVEEVDGQNMCLDCADDWYAALRKSNKRILEAEE